MNNDSDDTTLLEVRHLRMHFMRRSGAFRRRSSAVRAVDGVSFDMHRGETLGLVGESGCGKTYVGRSLIRTYTPTSGPVTYHRADGTEVDLAYMPHRALRTYWRALCLIFQAPTSYLTPRH